MNKKKSKKWELCDETILKRKLIVAVLGTDEAANDDYDGTALSAHTVSRANKCLTFRSYTNVELLHHLQASALTTSFESKEVDHHITELSQIALMIYDKKRHQVEGDDCILSHPRQGTDALEYTLRSRYEAQVSPVRRLINACLLRGNPDKWQPAAIPR